MTHHPRASAALFFAAGAIALLFVAPAAQASKGVVGSFGSEGGFGGQLREPTDVVLNLSGQGGATAGDIYVADTRNNRIDIFSPAGAFIRSWGDDVVASGTDNGTADTELSVEVHATGGTYILEYGHNSEDLSTSPIPYNASAVEVQAALNALSNLKALGSVTVTGGPDAAGSSYLVKFSGGSYAGNAAVDAGEGSDYELNSDPERNRETLVGNPHRVAIQLSGVPSPEVCNASPPSDDVCQAGIYRYPINYELRGISQIPAGGLPEPRRLAIDQKSGDVYILDRTRGVAEFSATGTPIRVFGQDVVASGPDRAGTSAVQTLNVTATGGQYTLQFRGFESEGTAELSFDAPATGPGSVEQALQGLATIGPGGVSVEKTAPGVYRITFSGALADQPWPLISAESASGKPLTGGTASVENTTEGATAYEICEPAKGDVCQEGEETGAGGSLSDYLVGIAVAPQGTANAGNILIADPINRRIDEYAPSGGFVRAFGWGVVASGPDRTGTGFEECIAANGDVCQAGTGGPEIGQISEPNGIVEGPSGTIYIAETRSNFRVQQFVPQPGPPALLPALFGTEGAPDGTSEANMPLTVAPGAGGNLLVSKYLPEGSGIQEFTADGHTLIETDFPGFDLGPFDAPVHFVENPASGAIYIPQPSGRIYILGATGGSPTAAIESVVPNTAGATVSAAIDPRGPGNANPNPPITTYRVEYKLASESSWKQFGSETPVGAGNNPVPVTVHLGGLEGDKAYEVRIVATKEFGEGSATTPAQEFTTTSVAPTVDSFTSSDVTADSAVLHAEVNPHGTATKCRFEYGATTAYGQTAPCPHAAGLQAEEIGSAQGDQSLKVELENLQSVTYHFRVVAESSAGTTTTEDQSFEFFPPGCPNAAVRQQTGSNYLPDCRGYELVSPSNAEGTLFYPGGPNTGLATNPSRLSYTGNWSAIPGANSINTAGDLYVATRTDQGWSSKYVGIPGNEAGCAGGPPTDLGSSFTAGNPPKLTDTVQTNAAMSQFLDWNDGTPVFCALGDNGTGDANYALAPRSNAPYLWNAEGSLVQRLPTDLQEVSGAVEAFQCPYQARASAVSICSGETLASGDLSHIAFSSNRLSFSGDEGLTEAPGSAYDNDVAKKTVKLISKMPSGENIPSGDGDPTGFIRFPAVSTDGSHILMATETTETESQCYAHTNSTGEACPSYLEHPLHLYMSIGDLVTNPIAGGRAVNYVGMTPDGSKVFFTSEEQLTSEDHDTSTDLYMWSEAGEESGHPLTLISKGDNAGTEGEPGNTNSCGATWVAKCGVVPWSDRSFTWATNGEGGNGISDSAIASANGDIYFYSPEQLDGLKGVEGQQNFYDYRDGEVHYVTTFAPEHHCVTNGFHFDGEGVCSEGPIARIDVSPDDTHMAFLTASRLTPYENAGHEEMYSYAPATGALICDSCNPDGEAATFDVSASQDGLFMTNDGRTFFSTNEALVSQDTDEAPDVYEFADGRPQLITPGTGVATPPAAELGEDGKGVNLVSITETPGLVGVSADGTDVYFSTFDGLIPEDHNGNFLRFYDARTDGGFAQPTPVPPCSAAEECHGAGSSAPERPNHATAAALSGGNAKPGSHAKHHKRKHHNKRHAHRSNLNSGAGK